MKNLKKVIIPVAGLGTRMLPATKAIPKELFPVAGIPVIQYIVKEVIDAGFSEIIFISRVGKTPIERYFENNYELEAILKKLTKKSLLNEIKEISNLKAKIIHVKQNKAKGLGHAILCAKPVISDEPFAVVLPDMLLSKNNKKNNLALMKKNFEKSGVSSLLLGKAKKSEIQNYGIVKLKNKNIKKVFSPLNDIVEKPLPKNAPSNLFVIGRYIFENEILSFLAKEKPDSSGEIQLTGAISSFLQSSKEINGTIIDGEVYDCGNKSGYLIANLDFSFKDRKIKNQVLKYLNK